MKVLYVCSRNEWRSRTAETIFKNERNIIVKSAGTSKKARVRVNRSLIEWSEIIFVMEYKHQSFLKKKYEELLNTKKIVVLNIPDEYKYMDDDLIIWLRDLFDHYLK